MKLQQKKSPKRICNILQLATKGILTTFAPSRAHRMLFAAFHSMLNKPTNLVDLPQVCDSKEDCPRTEVGDGGEDEESCYQEEGIRLCKNLTFCNSANCRKKIYYRKWCLGLWKWLLLSSNGDMVLWFACRRRTKHLFHC